MKPRRQLRCPGHQITAPVMHIKANSTATWEPGRSFADLQEKGPYRFWWHNHTFQADGPRTVMEDRV